MSGKFGVVILFFLGLTWSCVARISIVPFESSSSSSVHKNQVCELCDKYATLVIDYLQDEQNQKELVDALHMSCSQIPPMKKQCLAMVDRYTEMFFKQVSVIKPDKICKKLNLCDIMTSTTTTTPEENCETCRQTVSDVITKLKDPETKLKIIRLLLKECKSLNNYQDKCKKMVFEYGPVMLMDLEKFLEKRDLCSILRVCPVQTTDRRDYVPELVAVADS